MKKLYLSLFFVVIGGHVINAISEGSSDLSDIADVVRPSKAGRIRELLDRFRGRFNSSKDQQVKSIPIEVKTETPNLVPIELKVETPTLSEAISEIEEDKPLKVKTRDWGPKFDPIKALFAQATQDRKDLDDLRQRNIEKYLKMRDTEEEPNYMSLATNITEETIAYLNKRVTETIKDLGTPPTKFCIFTMGSMARQETGFYTDLEIGILVKEKNIYVVKYFQKFAQKLADRFFLLGEHPDVGGKGFRMDEADNSPAHLHFFARYACEAQAKSLLKSAIEKREFDKIPYEGSRIFIATPKEFAQHADPHFLEQPEEQISKEERDAIFKEELKKAELDPANKEKSEEDLAKEVKSLVNELFKPLAPREKQISASTVALVRNIRFLYGDKTLFDEYLKEREVYLSGLPGNSNPLYTTRRQEIGFSEMKANILKYLNKPDSSIVTGKLAKAVDIKRELYRFPEQILTDLGFMYDLPVQNTVKIAELLAEKGVISEESSKTLVRLMNYLIGLRLKKQEICRKQTYAMVTTLEEYEEQKKDLETQLAELMSSRAFLAQTFSSAADIAKVDAEISEIQSKLIDMQKQKPLEESSILSPDEIEKLNTIYLPIMKRLYEAAKEFVTGNKDAFLEMHLS